MTIHDGRTGAAEGENRTHTGLATLFSRISSSTFLDSPLLAIRTRACMVAVCEQFHNIVLAQPRWNFILICARDWSAFP